MAFSTLAAILYLSGTSLSLAAGAAIGAAVLLDLALTLRFHSTILMVFTGLAIFSVIVATQWTKLPPAFYARSAGCSPAWFFSWRCSSMSTTDARACSKSRGRPGTL